MKKTLKQSYESYIDSWYDNFTTQPKIKNIKKKTITKTPKTKNNGSTTINRNWAEYLSK